MICDLTHINGQQQSSSVSSQFVTSMLNRTPDAGIEFVFETTSQMDVQTPTSVAPLPVSAPTLTPSTIATITTTQQALNPSTIAFSTILQDLPNFGSLFGFDHRLKTLEANFFEFMQTNQFARISDRLRDEAQAENDKFLKTIDENMQKIIKEQVKEQVKTSYDVDVDLSEIELKKILIEKMEGNKSIYRSNEQRNLYEALVEAYESYKIILDTYGDTVTLKRCRDDDADKDEEPSAGSDRGSAGKSTQGSKSRQTSVIESATAEEPMQTTFEMEEPSHPEFETGADDQPIVEPSQHPEWFSQQKKPPTPDHVWNKTLPATHISIQPWISELAKQSDSGSFFNELMDTPVDFSAFLMNRLKVDTLTLELLAGPTYELMKGSCKILGHKHQQFFDFTVNREFARDVYSKCRIIVVTELKIVEWHNYKHFDWITVLRDDDKIYKFKEGDFKRLRIQDIKDMLLLLVQGKLTKSDSRRTLCFQCLSSNVYKKHRNPKACGRPSTRCRKLPEEAQPNKAGYVPDGTLTDVRTTLDDRLKGIRMKYLPQTIWRKSNKESAAAMVQAIDKKLKTRRIMRSLERHRYSNPMIQPEPEGSTQGYPLVSVEVLRNTKLLSGIEDSHHVTNDAMHNPSQPLKISNTVDDVGKDSDGLNSSSTKVTLRNSAVNKEGNMHDENDGLTQSKSTSNRNKENEVDVIVLVESIRAISERYIVFLGKRVAYPIVANYVKLYGVPVTAFSKDGLSAIATKLGTLLMLDSNTSDMCIQSCGRSSYARTLIEVRADVELKDNIVPAMPKLVEERFYTCNDEYPKNIDSDEVKNMKKPSQTPRGVPVSHKVRFKQVKQMYRQVSKKNNVNTYGNKKKDVEPTIKVSKSNPLDVLNSVENDIDFGYLVDDEGKPLKKVDFSGDHDSEDEVASVDYDMANFLASKKVGYVTNNMLEQWKESYVNGEYDFDLYDDDMYEGQEAIEGGENTKFFHGILNSKCSQLAIHRTLVDSEWIVDPLAVKSVFLKYFSTQFSSPVTSHIFFADQFTNRYWKFLKHDIVAAVKEFFALGIPIDRSLTLSYLFFADDAIFVEVVLRKNNSVFLSRMDGLILTNIPDRWVWSLEATGVYPVKSVRQLIDDSILPKDKVFTKWVKVMPIKINVFAWRVRLDKLPTRLNLSLKCIDISTIVCSLCHASIESGSHIFLLVQWLVIYEGYVWVGGSSRTLI
uniref:RNA-directed DNA polymerase, eukaryota n=1 Tax=Tanacetum cinerariifolium TaxID=118510 RepID=A0A6L2JN93_TANCI|nr:RNA-directed DNA polymerase, eukaryota [Tanacetum cinerariifolium]